MYISPGVFILYPFKVRKPPAADISDIRLGQEASVGYPKLGAYALSLNLVLCVRLWVGGA